MTEQQKTYEALGQRPYRMIARGNLNDYGTDRPYRTSIYEEISDGRGSLWGHRDLPEEGIFGCRFALNAHEFAEMSMDANTAAYIFRLPTGGQLGREITERLGFYRRRDYIRAGLRTADHMTLWEFVEASPPGKYQWSVRELLSPDGHSVYDVQRLSGYMDAPYTPDLEFIIDPNLRFMTTQWLTRWYDGRISEHADLSFHQADSASWLIKKFRHRIFTEGSMPRMDTETVLRSGIGNVDGTVSHEYSFEFDIELDYQAHAELFTWKGLSLPESLQVFVKEPDGTTDVHLLKNGLLVPREVFQTLENERLATSTAAITLDEPAGESDASGDSQHEPSSSASALAGEPSKRVLIAAIALLAIVVLFSWTLWRKRNR